MAIADDFEIQNDKDIRYTGTTANYTVLELHRWLQDRADDAASSGDDYMDITRDTPSDKSFDTIINLVNGFNVDDTAAQHLYGGSIIQAGGDVIYDGIQVLAPAGMRLEVVQNGALVSPNFWTTGLNADAPNGISHQFMLKVRTGGADIDGRRLLGLTREWGKTFLEFKINGTARGVNVMAFTGWADDLNNATSIGDLTSSPFTTVSLTTAGYNGIDVNNDAADKYYLIPTFWLPERAVEQGRNSQYDGWRRAGHLRVTDGEVIDFDQIEDQIRADQAALDMQEDACDPWQATQLIGHMLDEGVPMVEYRQTVQTMSEPMKAFEALVLQGKLVHDGNPMMTWMVSNVVCHRDAKDNIYPRKEREENKIDGAVAAIMALGRVIAGQSDTHSQAFVDLNAVQTPALDEATA